jgi:CII-binding regulator of phage lambda lysogenization HflD
LSFIWSTDKQALKNAFQKQADSVTENSSKLDMIELTQQLTRFTQVAQKLEKRMEEVKTSVKTYKQEWNRLINTL